MKHVQVKGQKNLNRNKTHIMLFWKSTDVW